MTVAADESGHEFEVRALSVARAIFDPLGVQGSENIMGRERDGVFVSEDAVNIFEITTSRAKDKAVKDATKLAEVLNDYSKRPDQRYKALTGWFITRDEPTADQRKAVDVIAKRDGVQIYCASLKTLYRRLCDAEGYLRARDNYPFGSTAYIAPGDSVAVKNIDPVVQMSGGGMADIKSLCDAASTGQRALLVGQFGVGKSHLLRGIYKELKQRYVKSGINERFPVHLNLKDCAGLRSPAEILRRHAEEIGFGGERGLISVWRAGACVLLLDGFDEVIPTRWMGNAADLKQVRWQALEPVRKLIQQAPPGTGIITCGRSHYFSSHAEMYDALGFDLADPTYELDDFTEQQASTYLEAAGISGGVPEWVPNRPLLLRYLVSSGALLSVQGREEKTRAEAWTGLVDSLCAREAMALSAVRSETIRRILGRVATLARSRGDETGPISMDQMKSAFFDVNRYEPDEEGTQLLLRLPGLAIGGDHSSDGQESRVFVDLALARAAYGLDLADYIASPYQGHALGQPAAWITAATNLAADVAAFALGNMGVKGKGVLAAADHRQSQGQQDAVLADIVRVADSFDLGKTGAGYMFEGVLFETVAPSDSDRVLANSHLKDCVLQVLDLSSVEKAEDCPKLENCLIGFLDGASAIPAWLQSRLAFCEIDEYSNSASTTAGIMALDLPRDRAVALTILKKVYSQRGSGRRESALSRGLDQASRAQVPIVLSALMSGGWLGISGSGRETIYVPIKGKRRDALQALEAPHAFVLSGR